MDSATAYSFIYPQMCARLSQSFSGKRILPLFKSENVNALWILVFNEEPPFLPQSLLIREFERKVESRFIAEFSDFLKNFDSPDALCLALLQGFEYRNVKSILAALRTQEEPSVVDIAPFSTVNLDALKGKDSKSAKDVLQNLVADTEFEWIADEENFSKSEREIWARLDKQYCRKIWSAAKKFHGESGKLARDFLKEEFVLQNLVWTLRLRVFHQKNGDEILPSLLCLDDSDVLNDDFASPAIQMFERDISDLSAWKNWEYFSLLNPMKSGVWTLDPSYFEQKSHEFLARRAKKLFHLAPFSSCALMAFFKIKEFEISFVRTAADAIALGIDINSFSDFFNFS